MLQSEHSEQHEISRPGWRAFAPPLRRV